MASSTAIPSFSRSYVSAVVSTVRMLGSPAGAAARAMILLPTLPGPFRPAPIAGPSGYASGTRYRDSLLASPGYPRSTRTLNPAINAPGAP
jgi:hypothetical protein